MGDLYSMMNETFWASDRTGGIPLSPGREKEGGVTRRVPFLSLKPRGTPFCPLSAHRRRRCPYRDFLGVFFAVGGQHPRRVALPSGPSQLIVTGRKVFFLRRKNT